MVLKLIVKTSPEPGDKLHMEFKSIMRTSGWIDREEGRGIDRGIYRGGWEGVEQGYTCKLHSL